MLLVPLRLLGRGLNYEPLSGVSDTEERLVVTRTWKPGGNSYRSPKCIKTPDSNWEFCRKIFDLMAIKTQGIVICGGDFIRLDYQIPHMVIQSPNLKCIN